MEPKINKNFLRKRIETLPFSLAIPVVFKKLTRDISPSSLETLTCSHQVDEKNLAYFVENQPQQTKQSRLPSLLTLSHPL